MAATTRERIAPNEEAEHEDRIQYGSIGPRREEIKQEYFKVDTKIRVCLY